MRQGNLHSFAGSQASVCVRIIVTCLKMNFDYPFAGCTRKGPSQATSCDIPRKASNPSSGTASTDTLTRSVSPCLQSRQFRSTVGRWLLGFPVTFSRLPREGTPVLSQPRRLFQERSSANNAKAASLVQVEFSVLVLVINEGSKRAEASESTSVILRLPSIRLAVPHKVGPSAQNISTSIVFLLMKSCI